MMTKNNYKILYGVVFAAVLLLWFRMHTFMISIVPWGVHLDEAALGYNAYCIANYGVDRYLNYMPVYVANFEGGQSALYTYMCAVLIKFMGTGTTVLRTPAFIFAVITLVSGFMIIRKKFGRWWALFGVFLMAVLPIFTQLARIGLDCNLMLGAVTLSLWVFIEAVEKGKLWLYLVDGFLWGISLYTYALSYVIVPVFLIIMGIYLIIIRRAELKKLLAAGVIFAVMAMPLFIMVIINRYDLNPIITPFFTIPRLGTDRAAELSFNGFFVNFVNMLKTIFYYDEMDYNALIGFRPMYFLSIPFVVIGACKCLYDCVKAVRNKQMDISMAVLVYCAAQLLVGGMRTNTNINNMNGVYFTFLYFVVAAVKFIFDIVGKYLKYLLLAVIIFCYLQRFVQFYDYYFFHHSRIDYPMFLFDGRLEDILEEFGEDFGGKTTYIDANHIYYLLAAKKSPYEVELTDGMSSYGNIHFVDETHTMPDFIDPDAIYIVQETNEEYMEFLRDSFEYETWSGFYHIFRN